MSDSSLTSIATRNAALLGDLTRQERPAASLTLTRTNVLAIVTTGTTVPWEVKTRGQGITYSTTDITIPTAGYYAIQCTFATSANVTMFIQLVVNTVNLGYIGYTTIVTGFHVATKVRYFATGDVMQIRLAPSANVNVVVNAENVLNPSPYLDIVQLTGVVT